MVFRPCRLWKHWALRLPLTPELLCFKVPENSKNQALEPPLTHVRYYCKQINTCVGRR